MLPIEPVSRHYHLKKEPIILTLQQAIMKGEISPERMHEIEEYISKRELARAIRCILSGDRTEAINIISKCRTRYLYSRKIMALVLLNYANRPLSIHVG